MLALRLWTSLNAANIIMSYLHMRIQKPASLRIFVSFYKQNETNNNLCGHISKHIIYYFPEWEYSSTYKTFNFIIYVKGKFSWQWLWNYNFQIWTKLIITFQLFWFLFEDTKPYVCTRILSWKLVILKFERFHDTNQYKKSFFREWIVY